MGITWGIGVYYLQYCLAYTEGVIKRTLHTLYLQFLVHICIVVQHNGPPPLIWFFGQDNKRGVHGQKSEKQNHMKRANVSAMYKRVVSIARHISEQNICSVFYG